MLRSPLTQLVVEAQTGDLAAFAQLVSATQHMAHAAARGVLDSDEEARDALQEAYLVAFRKLGELNEPEAFPGWLRRIVLGTALNFRRRRRQQWLPLNEPDLPPVLDDHESAWTESQQRALARALLALTTEQRRLCERYYFGGESAEALAKSLSIDAATVRKRLQRIRDQLRKEIEMDEQRNLATSSGLGGLPAQICELLARPRLVELPNNPVAGALAILSGAFEGFQRLELAEEVDLARAEKQLGEDAVYIPRDKLHRVAGERILRYDLSLPLLMTVRFTGSPLRCTASGKAYRREVPSATHIEAFHQLEVFALHEQSSAESFTFTGRILDSVDRLLPRAEVRVSSTDYPMCARAWSLDVLNEGRWIEVMAWGKYADWVLRAVGADPTRHSAFGAGYGLERLAALRYGIEDIRKVATARI